MSDIGARRLLLRNRIAVIFGLSAVLVMTIIGLSSALLWYWSEIRIDKNRREAAEAQWETALERAATRSEVVVIPMAEDPDLAAELAKGDYAALHERLDSELRAQETVERLDLLRPNGQVIASTADGPPPIDALNVDQVLGRGYPAVGIEPGIGGGVVFVVTVRGPGRTLLSAARNFATLLPKLAVAGGAELFLVDNQGKLVAATDPALWPVVEQRRSELDAGTVLKIASDARHYTAVPIPVRTSSGAALGTLDIVRDTTAEWEEKRLIAIVGGLLSTLLLVAAIFGVYGYVRSALDPLTGITRSVRALAGGNLFAAPEIPAGDDEVGQIAAAVEVFRANAVALDRAQIRDRLRDAQQQQLIRQEMARLAATLDEPARGQLIADLQRIEAGIDDRPVTERRDSTLASGFKHMATRVADQHRRLSELLQERTNDLAIVREALEERTQLVRLRQELEVAHDLQMASLRTEFPAFPGRVDFDLFAAMQPAKEVGGDFYDFTLLDNDRLALFVGDASGKGVSAAMFVAMSRALLRSAVARGSPLAEALAIANDALAVENETSMFTTAFVAVLELSAGRLRYANAGHNLPYLVRDGRVVALDRAMGVALGAIEGLQYEEAEMTLMPGDGLLLYSDGVTEAHNPQRSLFGEERLEAALAAWREDSPRALVQLVRDRVERFAAGEEQADDITLLAMRYFGSAAGRYPVGTPLEGQALATHR